MKALARAFRRGPLPGDVALSFGHYLKLHSAQPISRISRLDPPDEPCCGPMPQAHTNKTWETSCEKPVVSSSRIHESPELRHEVQLGQSSVLRSHGADQLLSGPRLLSRIRRDPQRAAEPRAARRRASPAARPGGLARPGAGRGDHWPDRQRADPQRSPAGCRGSAGQRPAGAAAGEQRSAAGHRIQYPPRSDATRARRGPGRAIAAIQGGDGRQSAGQFAGHHQADRQPVGAQPGCRARSAPARRAADQRHADHHLGAG